MKATSSSSSLDAARSRTTQPWRRAASWSRASASIVTASGSTPLTSHRAAATRFPFSSAQTRPALVEPVDRLVHGRRLDVKAARQLLEQRRKRRGQVQLGHGYATTATSTDEIAGR